MRRLFGLLSLSDTRADPSPDGNGITTNRCPGIAATNSNASFSGPTGKRSLFRLLKLWSTVVVVAAVNVLRSASEYVDERRGGEGGHDLAHLPHLV